MKFTTRVRLYKMKLSDAYKTGGPGSALKVCWRTILFMLKKVFFDRAVFIYFRHSGKEETIVPARVPLDIRKLDVSHLEAVAGLHAAEAESAKYRLLRERFLEGSDCLGAFHEDKLVAVVWGLYHKDFYEDYDLYVHPSDGEVVLSDGITVPYFRGRRTLPYLLGHHLNGYCERGLRAVMAIEQKNYASLRACGHYDFETYDRVPRLRILGLRIK